MPAFLRAAAAAAGLVRRAAGPAAAAYRGATVDVPAAPARRSERALAAIAHRGFTASLLVSAALLFGLLAVHSDAHWLAAAKLALGVTMAGEGFLLAANWRGARRLTLWRMRRARVAADPTTRPSLKEQLAWKLASPALQLLGVAWLAAGILTAALGLRGLV